MCRRRGRAGDDRALENIGGWLIAGASVPAYASLDRGYGCSYHQRGIGHHIPCDLYSRFGYLLRLDECGCRNGNDGASHLTVGIDDIGHVRIVVVVVDHCGVDDRVAAVDILKIAAAHGIRGLIDFPRP